jgi:hypothetical protein
MAFSGLHQLMLPLLAGTDFARPGHATAHGVLQESDLKFDGLGQLPVPQRDALATAFGVRVGPVPGPFEVGLAALNLLSTVTAEGPLLCIVDDAHWLDRDSARTLAFVARRLSVQSVVMLFAANEPNEDFQELPELVVGGLADAAALQLLDWVVKWPLDTRVRARILAEARGNPLALVELPRELSSAELAGGYGLSPTTLRGRSLSGRIEESFLQRVETLPADTQLLLLVAAAEPVGDPTLLWRAAEQLGIRYEALSPATTAGLIEVDVIVRFSSSPCALGGLPCGFPGRATKGAPSASAGDPTGPRSGSPRLAPRTGCVGS